MTEKKEETEEVNIDKLRETIRAEEKKKLLESEEETRRSAMIGVRCAQALCLGIFTLGLSMMTGDVSGAVKLPVSAMSITTTLFGGMGALICEVYARWLER